MPDIGPDMEDLLRKAAENYPLKQPADRWEEIAHSFTTQPAEKMLTTGNSKTTTRVVYLVLLLLLVIPAYWLWQQETADRQHTEPVQATIHPFEIPGPTKSVSPFAVRRERPLETGPNIKAVHTGQKLFSTVSGVLITQEKEIHAERYSETLPGSDKRLGASRLTGITPREEQPVVSLYLQDFLMPVFTLQQFKGASIPAAALALRHDQNMRKGFYYGLIAGPSMNVVMQQEMNKMGFNIGFTAGYRFSRRVTVETGIILSRKIYSTTGEHFSMKIIGPNMPASMQIMEVEGKTSVIEIPIHARLDVIRKRNANLFITAGIASRIADKENNQYHTLTNGNETMMYGTYKNSSSAFASSVNAGIGYEKQMNSRYSIRVQPYVQIPVKGLGVGDLQVLSTGIHFGILRKAH